MSEKNPTQKLEEYLRRSYPHRYTLQGVELSDVPGYLLVKPYPESRATISIAWVGYPRRDRRGRFLSPYKLWNELQAQGGIHG